MSLQLNLSDFREGLELFNAGLFFDAHEVLEDIWRRQTGDRASRRHWQGLIQLAVAFHHWTNGNVEGSHSVLERALRNLEGAEGSLPNIDLVRLRSEAGVWLRHLKNLRANSATATNGQAKENHSDGAPPLPVIRWRSMTDSAL